MEAELPGRNHFSLATLIDLLGGEGNTRPDESDFAVLLDSGAEMPNLPSQ
jgi:hypothetical protein